MREQWSLAKGTAGFNVVGEVWGAYVNGVALFAFQTDYGARPFFYCVVTGHLTAGARTLDSAMVRGEALALQYGTVEADRKLSRKEFRERMESLERGPDNFAKTQGILP